MALGLASIIVAWFMQQNGNGSLVLPAAVVTGLTILNTVIGLFSSAVGKTAAISASNSVGGGK